MKLKFPPLSGGITQGLNDAGIETFEGDYAHYVVRECGQNSLDAAASVHQPVEIEIGMRLVRADELPFIGELRDTLERCGEFWQNDEKAREFFEHGLELAGRKDITLLRISDFGTTGVPGGDDEMNSPWFGLVRSRGVSVKRDETSAGAFGIGKDAPLAASSFRTVVYSTRTQDGKVAAQGICRLATLRDEADSLTQGTGFIGNYSARGGSSAMRTEHEIPALFQRDKPGLDVWVVGFQANVGDWEDEFVAATLRNFWPAIHFQKLKVRVGQQNINQQTLPRLMDRFRRSDDSVSDAYPYFQAVVGAGSHLREKASPLGGRLPASRSAWCARSAASHLHDPKNRNGHLLLCPANDSRPIRRAVPVRRPQRESALKRHRAAVSRQLGIETRQERSAEGSFAGNQTLDRLRAENHDSEHRR